MNSYKYFPITFPHLSFPYNFYVFFNYCLPYSRSFSFISLRISTGTCRLQSSRRFLLPFLHCYLSYVSPKIEPLFFNSRYHRSKLLNRTISNFGFSPIWHQTLQLKCPFSLNLLVDTPTSIYFQTFRETPLSRLSLSSKT